MTQNDYRFCLDWATGERQEYQLLNDYYLSDLIFGSYPELGCWYYVNDIEFIYEVANALRPQPPVLARSNCLCAHTQFQFPRWSGRLLWTTR